MTYLSNSSCLGPIVSAFHCIMSSLSTNLVLLVNLKVGTESSSSSDSSPATPRHPSHLHVARSISSIRLRFIPLQDSCRWSCPLHWVQDRKLLDVILGFLHFAAMHLPGITVPCTLASGSIPSLQYGQHHGLLNLWIFLQASRVSPVWLSWKLPLHSLHLMASSLVFLLHLLHRGTPGSDVPFLWPASSGVP